MLACDQAALENWLRDVERTLRSFVRDSLSNRLVGNAISAVVFGLGLADKDFANFKRRPLHAQGHLQPGNTRLYSVRLRSLCCYCSTCCHSNFITGDLDAGASKEPVQRLYELNYSTLSLHTDTEYGRKKRLLAIMLRSCYLLHNNRLAAAVQSAEQWYATYGRAICSCLTSVLLNRLRSRHCGMSSIASAVSLPVNGARLVRWWTMQSSMDVARNWFHTDCGLPRRCMSPLHACSWCWGHVGNRLLAAVQLKIKILGHLYEDSARWTHACPGPSNYLLHFTWLLACCVTSSCSKLKVVGQLDLAGMFCDISGANLPEDGGWLCDACRHRLHNCAASALQTAGGMLACLKIVAGTITQQQRSSSFLFAAIAISLSRQQYSCRFVVPLENIHDVYFKYHSALRFMSAFICLHKQRDQTFGKFSPIMMRIIRTSFRISQQLNADLQVSRRTFSGIERTLIMLLVKGCEHVSLTESGSKFLFSVGRST